MGKKNNKIGGMWGGLLGILLIWTYAGTYAVQIEADASRARCRQFHLHQELPIYKDPSLFVGKLSQIYQDPQTGWEELMNENPLLTKMHGDVMLMIIGEPRKFENFGPIAKLYEVADPQFRHRKTGQSKSPEIVSVKACGGSSDAYNDTIGFVSFEDLKQAQKKENVSNQLPPSVYPNPVPKL